MEMHLRNYFRHRYPQMLLCRFPALRSVPRFFVSFQYHLLANVLLSVGTPGIPGGAIASFAALATMAGLPAGVMGVYISINTLCDMGATCVNVIGDLAACVVLKEKIKLNE